MVGSSTLQGMESVKPFPILYLGGIAHFRCFIKTFLPSFFPTRTFRRGAWRLTGSPCFWRRRAFLSLYFRSIFSDRAWSCIERSGPRQVLRYRFPHRPFASRL